MNSIAASVEYSFQQMMNPFDPSPLFAPFAIKGITLPNRFVMPGMQRMWRDNGTPLPCLADYYRERVEGGVGLIITESCAVDHPSATQTPVFCRITDATMGAWARCFDVVNFRRANFGHMEVDVTIDDPKAYSRPWKSDTMRFTLKPDTELLEHLCENNRDLPVLERYWRGQEQDWSSKTGKK